MITVLLAISLFKLSWIFCSFSTSNAAAISSKIIIGAFFKIVVIDQGKVESVGNHAKLLQTSTIYKKLYENAQLAENFQY